MAYSQCYRSQHQDLTDLTRGKGALGRVKIKALKSHIAARPDSLGKFGTVNVNLHEGSVK
jgi:hypothetical protein